MHFRRTYLQGPALLTLPLVAAAAAALATSGCGGGGHDEGHGMKSRPGPAPAHGEAAEQAKAPEPEKVLEKAKAFFGTPPPVAKPKYELTDAKVDLGRMLYYETRLSKNHDISCNSCHDLAKYGVDSEATSPGHKKQLGDRNSPTVYNAAFHFAQFWDGRAATVEEQAKGPVLNPVEMAMPDEDTVLATLKSMPEYQERFDEAFPERSISFDTMAEAIGAFERKLVTPAPFDDFLAGKTDAISPEAVAGLDKFMSAGCTTCHTGATVGGTMYQKLGVTKPYPTKDEGRFKVTGVESDKYVFKVPSLRNVAKTAPYLHDGSVDSLEEMVKIMAKHQLATGELSDEEAKSIVAFLETLTGEIPKDYIAKPDLPESTPDTPPPDAS